MTNWPLIHLYEARGWTWRNKYRYRRSKRQGWQISVQRAEHWRNAKSKARAEAEVHKWGRLEGEAAQKVHWYAKEVARLRPHDADGIPAGEGICVPRTAWNPSRRRLANWIARELREAWKIEQGWYVTSGVRSDAEQAILYHRYKYEGGNIAAPPGVSNHRGWNLREPWRSGGSAGAVDAEPAERLNSALVRKPSHHLLWAETHGLADHPHFSATGH